ncbi:hypothetical protein ACSBR2_026141 [Camellia fascicularis]
MNLLLDLIPNHLLLLCPFSSKVWSEIIDWWGLSWISLRSIQELLVWWYGRKFKNLGKTIWEALPLDVLWSLWRVRNEKVFNQKEPNWKELVELIKIRVSV